MSSIRIRVSSLNTALGDPWTLGSRKIKMSYHSEIQSTGHSRSLTAWNTYISEFNKIIKNFFNFFFQTRTCKTSSPWPQVFKCFIIIEHSIARRSNFKNFRFWSRPSPTGTFFSIDRFWLVQNRNNDPYHKNSFLPLEPMPGWLLKGTDFGNSRNLHFLVFDRTISRPIPMYGALAF